MKRQPRGKTQTCGQRQKGPVIHGENDSIGLQTT